MKRILPLLLALLFAGTAAAESPAPTEQPLSAAEFAVLQQRIQTHEARMNRDLEARIERQTARWLASRQSRVDPRLIAAEAEGAGAARIRH